MKFRRSPSIGPQRNHIDLQILVGVLALMVFSLGVVYSASSTWSFEKFGGSERLLGSHAVKVLAGFTMILVFMNVDYRKYKRISKPVLLASILLLAVTLVLGGEVKGASRWLCDATSVNRLLRAPLS